MLLHLLRILQWMIPYFCTMERVQILCLWLNLRQGVRITQLGHEQWGKLCSPKNKLGFIDGTLTLSSPLVSTPLAVQAWIRCDNMVGLGWQTQFLVSFKLVSSMKTLPWQSITIWEIILLKRMFLRFTSFKRKLQNSIKVRLPLLISSLNWRFFGINCKTIVIFLLVLAANAHEMWIRDLMICNIENLLWSFDGDKWLFFHK